MSLIGRVRAILDNPLLAIARLYTRPLPRVGGTERLAGLSADVEVLRDRWGVPHVYARSLADALAAQGYVHAQDRLWQLELNRRVALGRLSELFGELAFEADRMLRTLGLGPLAERALASSDGETRALLDAYARGVNAFIDAHRSRLPVELTLLRAKPEPWRAVDSLAWAQFMAWSLSCNWDSELINAAVVGRVGAERAARLLGEYPRTNPIVLPDHEWAPLIDRVIEQYRAAEAWLPIAGVRGMSNNWVVSGARSSTGKPLLANDPHLAPQLPSIWHECHLVCPELEVAGVALPGAPGVVIGHNREIAWGFTAAVPDTQDLYLEEFDPQDSKRYRFRDGWERATVRREEIRVKGERAPRVVEVVSTRHGPLITALSPLTHGKAIALKWIAHEESRTHHAILALNRAHDWASFRAALADWTAPAMNVVYADRAGNIGYQFAGRVPVRARGLGLVPAPGWSGEHEWTGTIPVEELPSAFNPERGVLASANNVITGASYRHFLSAETMNGFRVRRILELLDAKPKLDAADFARIQVDQYCAPAKAFCALVAECVAELGANVELGSLGDRAEFALRALTSWDHHLSADSVPGAIYELAQHFAARRVFEPWLGDLTDHYLGVGFHPLLNPVILGRLDRSALVAVELLERNDREWLRNAARRPVDRAEILAGAIADAVRWLTSTLGGDQAAWRWGAIHQIGFQHPLGAKKPLDKIFNRGPFPYGGDTNTVWQAAFVPRMPPSSDGGFTASWRQIIDLGDWDASRGVHAPGQSGHLASPHYDDQIAAWLAGETHPMLWSRARVEAHAEARLVLAR
jgi:penicillin amidase